MQYHSEHQKSILNTNKTFSVQFSTLLVNVVNLLDSNCKDKLEMCKQFCWSLRISDSSDILIFSDENLAQIDKCTSFDQLFCSNLRKHWSWEEYSILEHIIDLSGSQEAEHELDKYKKFMASKIAMEIILNTFREDQLPPNCVTLSVIIDKPYTKLTIGEYVQLKEFIFNTLEVKKYIAYPYIKFLFGSLHLQWYIPVQATDHIVMTATRNHQKFLEEKVVFIEIGEKVVMECQKKKFSASIMVSQLYQHAEVAYMAATKVYNKRKSISCN